MPGSTWSAPTRGHAGRDLRHGGRPGQGPAVVRTGPLDRCPRWPGRRVARVGLDLAAGLLALDRLDDTAVTRSLDDLADGADPADLWPFACFLAASHAMATGRAAEGLIRLDRSRAVHDADQSGPGAATDLVDRARADLLVACGRGDQAAAVIARGGVGRPWMRVPAARLRSFGHAPGPRPGGPVRAGPAAWSADTPERDRVELLLLGAVRAPGRGATTRRPGWRVRRSTSTSARAPCARSPAWRPVTWPTWPTWPDWPTWLGDDRHRMRRPTWPAARRSIRRHWSGSV